MQELDSWLQALPAAWGGNLLTCTPADLVVYFESHWLAQHAGTTLPDGSVIASPSGVSQLPFQLLYWLQAHWQSWGLETPEQ